MRPGVLDINTSAYTQSPTDATGLDPLTDIYVFILKGRLFALKYRQATEMGMRKAAKRFVME